MIVGDFCLVDVVVGGNGLFCICIYDLIILRLNILLELGWRIVINIGGIISIIFCLLINDDVVLIGLDFGLGVFFMDLVVCYYDDLFEYDINGNIVWRGKIY